MRASEGAAAIASPTTGGVRSKRVVRTNCAVDGCTNETERFTPPFDATKRQALVYGESSNTYHRQADTRSER
jgi:hypothetical protein